MVRSRRRVVGGQWQAVSSRWPLVSVQWTGVRSSAASKRRPIVGGHSQAAGSRSSVVGAIHRGPLARGRLAGVAQLACMSRFKASWSCLMTPQGGEIRSKLGHFFWIGSSLRGKGTNGARRAKAQRAPDQRGRSMRETQRRRDTLEASALKTPQGSQKAWFVFYDRAFLTAPLDRGAWAASRQSCTRWVVDAARDRGSRPRRMGPRSWVTPAARRAPRPPRSGGWAGAAN